LFQKEFLLTFEEYIDLIKDNECDYCGGELPKQGTKLDRVNSDKPYELGNCVPCCKKCNSLKSNILTHFETKMLVNLLKVMRGGKVW
jgi:hypothetical protein